MTEPTYYEEYEDYFEPVEVKQSDDISAEVDVNTKFILTMVSKHSVLVVYRIIQILNIWKLKQVPNTNRGPRSLSAHDCKPGHSVRQSTEYNMGDIGKSLMNENWYPGKLLCDLFYVA